MRIGIDGRLWGEAGVGRYIRNLVRELSKIDNKNDYYLLLLKKHLGQKLPKNFHEVEADFRWYGAAEQRQLPKLLKSLNLDLVHFPHFNIPVFYSGKFVVTIHDLIHQHHKMNRATTLNPLIYKLKHMAYNHAFKTSLKKSQKIITVSEFVKKQLKDEMGVSENKIVVTHEAVEGQLITDAAGCNQEKIKKVQEKYGITPPFIYYVGNAHSHKNVEGLIKAFLELRKKYQYLQLVLSGHDHYFWERVKKEFMDSRLRGNDKGIKDVIFTGYVSDVEMVALYKSCQVYVFPSFEEGFGIPLLEAMACGAPVVSSNAASLPEIGGDAVLYFDPKNTEDMADKIQYVLNNQFPPRHPEALAEGSKNLRKFLMERGLIRG